MIYRDRTFMDCYSFVKTDETHVHLLSTDGLRRKRVLKADFMRDYEALPEVIGADDECTDSTRGPESKRDLALRVAVALALLGLIFLALKGK